MRRFAWCAAGILAAMAFAAADPAPRGRLVYPDGNRLTAPGVFASDRFGEVRFRDGEARFEPAPATTPEPDAATAVRQTLAASATPEPAPATDREAPPSGPKWRFSLSGYLDGTREAEENTREYFLSFRANRPRKAGDEYLTRFTYEHAFKGDLIDKRNPPARPSGGTTSVPGPGFRWHAATLNMTAKTWRRPTSSGSAGRG